MQTSDVLYRAADLIEERGWWGGQRFEGTATPLCASNAIAAATKRALPEFTLAHDALISYLGCGYLGGIFAWNDRQSDATPIIEVLRACAVIEESRERQAVEVSA